MSEGPAGIQALLLGIVQGLTEFLPVSSSGHLALAHAFLGAPAGGVAFAILLHAGTLLAIALVFPDGIRRIVVGGLALPAHLRRPPAQWPEDVVLAGKVLAAAIPGGVVGLALQDRVEAAFSSPAAVGALLLGTGGILLATRLARPGGRPPGWRDAWLVGLAQALAILPGISRSGTTIAAALLLGVARGPAAEFSFLASVPLIAGSTLIAVPELADGAAESGWAPLVLGFSVSFAVGWLALRWLMRIVRGGRLHLFAPYCFAVGTAALVLALRA